MDRYIKQEATNSHATKKHAIDVIDLTKDEEEQIVPLETLPVIRRHVAQTNSEKLGKITRVFKAKGREGMTKRETLAVNGNKLTSYTQRTPTGRITVTHEQFAKPRKMPAGVNKAAATSEKSVVKKTNTNNGQGRNPLDALFDMFENQYF